MNKLTARLARSKYIEDPHLVLFLDGDPLDLALARSCNNPSLEGLVTTLDDCLIDVSTRSLVWETVLPKEGSAATAPLLVCPDDLDFDCTVVVVQIQRIADRIVWTRLGVTEPKADATPRPGLLPSTVRWFEEFRPLEFDAPIYEATLERCRELKSDWWPQSAE